MNDQGAGIALAAALLGLGCGGPASAIASNESRVVEGLRDLVRAQDCFRLGGIVDQDWDGSGEFGWLGELAGVDTCRVTGLAMSGSPYVTAGLGRKDAGGRATWHGYHFRLFLPTKDGPARGEAAGSAYRATAGSPPHPDADVQEQRWACYAWPVQRGVTGARTFVATQEGWVYATGGSAVPYGGTDRCPAAGAAFVAGDARAANLDAPIARAGAKRTAVDGNRWVEVLGPVDRGGPIESRRR